MSSLIARHKLRAVILGVSTIFTLVILSIGNTPQAASIAQGYSTTDSELVEGMAASLSSDSSSSNSSVERASLSNKGRFVGIVTTKDANLLTLGGTTTTLYATTLGETTAYVSDVNGPIANGDFLAVSPLKGILMHASPNEPTVVGTALSKFDSSKAESQKIKAADGSSKTVHIGLLKIELNPRNVSSENPQQKQKSFLQLVGEGITGKTVSDWQVIAVLVIFLMLLVVEGSLMYGAIHGTLIAIGRNPLSRSGVYKQLLQVLITGVAVLGIGIAVIFVVLKV